MHKSRGNRSQWRSRAGRTPAASAHRAELLAADGTPVDKQVVVPLYYQVYERLRDDIVAGVYPAGGPLPSEREVCTRYGVSRITTRRAFERLIEERLIVRRHGAVSRVTDSPPVASMRGDLQTLLDNVAVIAAATTGRLVEMAESAPGPAVLRDLGLGQRARAHRSTHLRLRDGMPLGLIITWVPLALARGITATDIEHTPMIALLDSRGVRVSWAVQSIGATVAEGRTAALLAVPRGAPLVRLKRIVYDRNDRPIEHLTAYYRADRYEYRTVLRRDPPRRRVRPR